MSNLKSIVADSPMTQSGGRGYHHKKRCKCPLCKKGGADPDDDYDNTLDNMEMGTNPNTIATNNNNNQNFANDDDYDDLDKIERGESTGKGPGEFKAGGSYKRKSKKRGTKKRTHKKRKVNRRGRKTRRYKRKH